MPAMTTIVTFGRIMVRAIPTVSTQVVVPDLYDDDNGDNSGQGNTKPNNYTGGD